MNPVMRNILIGGAIAVVLYLLVGAWWAHMA